MSTKAIIHFATLKVKEVCEALKGKEIPNVWKYDDTQGFTMSIREGDLNLNIVPIWATSDVEENAFLMNLSITFVSQEVTVGNIVFPGAPTGPVIENQYPVYGSNEQEVQDGVLQVVEDEIEDILCRMLQ